MATVIDTLIVELGLDPKNFTKGQKDAIDSMRKMQEGAERGGKNIEAQGKKFSQFFGGIKQQALGLFAAFMGGRGAKDFAIYLTNINSQAGRTAYTLKMTSKELVAWQNIARQTGGSAEEMAGAMQGLSGQVYDFLNGIGDGKFLGVFTAMHVDIKKANGEIKTASELFFDLARAVEKMDPARARSLLASLGLPDGVISSFLLGEKRLKGLYDTQMQLATASTKDTAAAGELAKSWNEATTAAERLGTKVMTLLTPAMSGLLSWVAKLFNWSAGNWEKAIQENIKKGIAPDYSKTGSVAPTAGPGTPAASAAEQEAYIRQAAINRGMDPEQAVRVARSEGLNQYVGDENTSFGPFQLHYGGRSIRHRSSGLGDKFTAQTGLDARDPSTWKKQVDFSLDEAKKGGWSPWHGWKGLPFEGINPAGGAGPAAGSFKSGDNKTTNTTINVAKLEVTSSNASPLAVAQEIPDALRRMNETSSANYGLTG